MSISFACPRGHRLSAAEHLAGKSIQCPKCGSLAKIPQSHHMEPAFESLDLDDADASGRASAAQRRPSQLHQAAAAGAGQYWNASAPIAMDSPGNASSRAPDKFWVGLTVGGSFACGLLATLLTGFWLRSESAPSEGTGAIAQVPVAQMPTAQEPNAQVPAAERPTVQVPAAVDSPESSPAPRHVEVESSKSPAPAQPRVSVASAVQAPVDAAAALAGRRSAAMREALAKLRRIQLALLNYEASHKFLAPAVGQSEPGSGRKSLLSWRVHILPYLDNSNLFNQFHLDEPWDSPHNRSLVEKMPPVYRLPGDSNSKTRFQVVQGNNMLFNRISPAQLAAVTDGTPNTLLALTVGADKAVPWTQPEDFEFKTDAPLQSLGNLPDGLFAAVPVSGGRPRVFSSRVPPAALLAMLTPGGGEAVQVDHVEKESMLADGISDADLSHLITYLDGASLAEYPVADGQ